MMNIPSDPALQIPAISASSKGRGRLRRSAAILVALVTIAYLPAFRGGFVLDDDDYVTQNSNLHSLDGLRKIWCEVGASPDYYALVHTSFWVEHHLWGDRPLGYHAVNICLHAINAFLLWRILRVLKLPAPWLCAAVFAVHPVGVESVAWVAERKNTLSLMFALASLWCYLRFEPLASSAESAGTSTPRWRYYFAALALFIAALLSKTAVAPLPVVLLICYWWKRGHICRATACRFVPFFLLAAGMGALTVWIESHFNGAHGEPWSFSAAERLLIAGRALCFYAAKAIWPHPLVFVYPRWTVDALQGWQWLFPLAAGAALVGMWALRRKIGRGPFAASLIFAVALSPVLGAFNISYMRYSFVADHFQYHALAASICLTASAVCLLADKLPWKLNGPINKFILAATVGCLMLLTWRQSSQYVDAITLYQATLDKNPDCWLIHYNLANALVAADRPAEAIEHFEQAIRIKPDCAEAHNNLAMQLAAVGQLSAAIEHYEQAVDGNPKLADAHANYGLALLASNRPQAAMTEFERALELQPQNAEAHNNLGGLLLQNNRIEAAIEHYRQALRHNPGYLQAQFNLAVAYAKQHDASAALDAGEKALRLAQAMGDIATQRHVERWLSPRRAAMNVRTLR